MSLTKSFLLRGLLQYNYFPAQKKSKEEIPSILNSTGFTPKISEKLIKLDARKGGYDQVEYKATRYNNVPRTLSIPHPLAYAKLCHSLHDNWQQLKYITNTKTSLIIPTEHSDGRIIIMDYETTKEQIQRHVNLSFKNKFYVETDISNFYPSIYTHSIPWALVGFETAKKDRDEHKWFNQIDSYQRSVKREETNGIPIGPATSNIICESILARIDQQLNAEGFVFRRFIDDYAAYFTTYEKAEEYVRRLSEELSKYKLSLNIKKTAIIPLPIPSSSEWIADLTTRIPAKGKHSTASIIRYLDYAVKEQGLNLDGSIIKYAVKTIIYDLDGDTAEVVLQYLISLCIKYPILLPLLDTLFEKTIYDRQYTNQLLSILNEHTLNKRSDAMTWSLYYLNKHNQAIPNKIAENVVSSNDCIPILFLYLSKQHDNKIKAFCNSLDKSDLFLLDQYWLLLYQLFFDSKIPNPYQDKTAYTNNKKGRKDIEEAAMKRETKVFELMRSNKVSFIKSI